jgi:hypothetical protein
VTKGRDATPHSPTVSVVTDTIYREIRYTVTAQHCTLTWVVHTSEVNRGVVSQRMRCPLPPKELITLLAPLLQRVLADTVANGMFTTLFWGRLCEHDATGDEFGARLASAAASSDAWDRQRGKARSGHENDAVRRIANTAGIYAELDRLFARFGLTVEVTGVEKVLIAPAGTLPFYEHLRRRGVNAEDRVPYDCLTWLGVGRAAADPQTHR